MLANVGSDRGRFRERTAAVNPANLLLGRAVQAVPWRDDDAPENGDECEAQREPLRSRATVRYEHRPAAGQNRKRRNRLYVVMAAEITADRDAHHRGEQPERH